MMRSTVFDGVDGVQRREHEVPGFRRRQRDLDGLAVAHLADEDHLRRLPQRRRERRGERRRVAVQLALVDGRLLVLVQELDRILDGEDVFGAGLVDQIDDRRQRRRLARAGRTGDQDDAVLERGGLGQRPAAASSSASVGIREAMTRMTMANVPRCRKMLTRNRPRSGSE